MDEDPTVRRLLELGLPRFGFRVFMASNLGEAVALLDRVRQHVRVALLDVSMPGGNGPACVSSCGTSAPCCRPCS
jgi:DNA-binding response OmpR family regulator